MAADSFDWGTAKLSSADGKPVSAPAGDFDWSTASIDKPRSALGEIGNQLKAGTLVDLPRMIAKAGQAITPAGSGANDLARRMAIAADQRSERADLQPHPEQHNVVTNALASGARMLPQSIAPAAIVGAGIAALPVELPAAVTLGGAAALGSLPAALSQGQDTYEKGIAAGLPEDQARSAAIKTGAIEGLGETAGTYAGGKLFGIAAKAFKGAAPAALDAATGRAFVKPYLKQLGETAAVETGTEIGQNAGEAAVEKNAGIDNTSPVQAGLDAIAPTLGMTALLAPFGLAGHGVNARGKANRANLLSSADSPENRRAAAARAIADELHESDPAAAANFAAHAEAAIRSKTPLNIGEDLLQPYQEPQAPPPLQALPAPAVARPDGPELAPDAEDATDEQRRAAAAARAAAILGDPNTGEAERAAAQLYAERDQEAQRRELAMASTGLEVGTAPTQAITLADGSPAPDEELPSAEGLQVGDPEQITLTGRGPAPDEMPPSVDGIEVGEAESPRIEMLKSMAARVQNPGARRFIESQIKAERSTAAAAVKRTQDAASADELRGLAAEAAQAGDLQTHAALMDQADKLTLPPAEHAEATAARVAAQQIIDAGNAPNAGPLARAVASGMSSALTAASAQQGAGNVLDTASATHGGASGIGGEGQRADVGRTAGMADVLGAAGEQRTAGGEAAGVPVAGSGARAPLGDAGAQRSVPLSKGWAAFAPETGSLGIPRAEMPQIAAEHRGAMVNFLGARGVTHEQIEVDPATLKPTQAEFSPAKVIKAGKFKGGDRSILVSSDGHIVDGHHQWLAKVLTGQPIKAIQLNAPIAQLLPQLKEFPSAEAAAGAMLAKRSTPTTAKQSAEKTADHIGERGRLGLLGILKNVGGIEIRERSDITGERGRSAARAAPGLFRKEGRGIDDIATVMHEAGYLTDADREDVDGGVQKARDLIADVISKRPVVPLHLADEYARLRHEESLSAREAAEESGATPERLSDLDSFGSLVASELPGDIIDHALLSEIGEIDEAALERAGIQYENNDTGLMAWAQEWIHEHRKQTENAGASARGRSAQDSAPREAGAGARQEGAEDAGRAHREAQANVGREAEGDGSGVAGEPPTDGPFIQEPTQYTYGHDGNPANVQRSGVAAPTGANAGRGEKAPVPGQLDLFSAEGKPRAAVPEKRDGFWVNVKAVKTGTFRSGVERVTTPEEAAHVLAPLRREPQESLLALVTDKDGKPLSIIRNTIGAAASAPIDIPAMLGGIHRVPGAAKVWFAHNHPSGEAQQSGADIKLTDMLTDALRGTGVESQGMIVVAPGGKASFYDGLTNPKIKTVAAARRLEIPVTGRRFAGRTKEQLSSIATPEQASQLLSRMPESAGLLLVDAQRQPVAWIPMEVSGMTKLRTGDSATGAGRIMQALERSNASGLIIKLPSDDKAAVENIQKLANAAGVELLDAIADGKSKALLGHVPVSGAGRNYFSLAGGRTSSVSRVADLQRALTRRFGIGVGNLQKSGILNIVQSFADLPADVQQRVNDEFASIGSDSIVRAVYVGESGKAYLISDLMSPEQAPAMLLHEVGEHYGLQRLLGDGAYARLLADVRAAKGRAPAVREAWAAVLKRYTNLAEGEDSFVREVIAHVAESADAVKLGWFKSMLQAIRLALRKLGFSLRVTDDDLRALALASLRRAMRDKAPSSQAGQAAPMASLASTLNAPQREALRKAGLVFDERTAPEKIRDGLGETLKLFSRDTLKRAEEGLFNRFAPIRDAEKGKKLSAADSPYVAARLSTGSSSTMTALLMFGQGEWRDGVIQKKAGTKGLLSVLEPVRQDLDSWAAWMVAKRAEQLAAQGREHNLSAADIAALKSIAPGREAVYEDVARQVRDFHTSALRIAQGAGLLSPEQVAAFSRDRYYIPFYRVDENEEAALPFTRRGLSHQSSGIKQLKGGSQALNDPIANMLANVSRLVDASLKNNAALKAVKTLPEYFQEIGDQDSKANAVRVMDGGQPRWYKGDASLMRAMAGFTADKWPAGLAPFKTMKRLLTAGVTADPAFIVRNFTRDVLYSWGVARDKITPLVSSLQGVRAALTHDEDTQAIMFAGASFLGGGQFGGDFDTQADTLRRAMTKKGFPKSAADTLAIGPKFWQMYRELGEAVENSNRIAVFKAAQAQGKTVAEAVYESKDLMDYSLQGSWTAVRLLADVVPFFNARLQGLYRLGRAANNKQLYYAGGAVAAASIALLLANGDDDRWKALTDEDKDLFWHVFVGDLHYRIPKPFELGTLFGTLPERIGMAMMGQDAKLGKRALWAFTSTFAMDPTPQLVKPALETFFNYDTFRDAPIEGMSDEGKIPEARYDSRTSELMKWFGAGTGTSPKMLEHLWNGYTGTLGGYILSAADGLVRWSQPGQTAEMQLRDYPVLGSFVRSADPTASRYSREMYDTLKKAEQVYRTARAYQVEGRVEDARKLIEDNKTILAQRKMLNGARETVSRIRKNMDAVKRDPELSAHEKRGRLDRLEQQVYGITKRVVEASADK